MEISGIPWHFKNPELIGAYWHYKTQETLKSLRNEASAIEKASNKPGLLDLTTKRLRKLKQAKFEQAIILEKILAPLSVFEESSKKIPPIVLKELFPNQNLLSYIDNIHRDWSWGEEENLASLKLVQDFIFEDQDEIVYLGSGSSRFAYDVHETTKTKKTTLVDINPLLLLVAKSLIEGEKVKLYDFPIAPLGHQNAFVLNKLKAPKVDKEGFHYLFSDVLDLPFENASKNFIVTPWLVDILPGDPKNLLLEINRVLANEGTWVHFGPLGFSYQDQEYRLSKEEYLAQAEALGFECVGEKEEIIPYMDSPHSQHARREHLYCFKFIKKQEATKSESENENEEQWLADTSKAVPLDEKMNVLKQTHGVYNSILSLVDGRTPIDALAKKIGPQWGLSDEEAKTSLINFFKGL